MTAEGPTGHEPHAEASFSPNGRRVVTAFGDGTVRVWDAISGQPISATMKHSGPVNSAAFSPDGSRIVTAGNDGTARIWNADTGSPISPLLEHAGPLNRASFSPDGNYILTSSADAPTKLWPLCKEMGPSWVLDLAETLAQCRVDDTGNPAFYRGKPLEGLRQLSADESNKTHPMVLWAKGLLKRDPL